MRETTYIDERGRKWAVLIPDGAQERDAYLGMTIGPPAMDALGLPEEMTTRLHNALFDRRIFTEEQARRHPMDIVSAIRSAIVVDAKSVIALYGEPMGDILATTPEDTTTVGGENP